MRKNLIAAAVFIVLLSSYAFCKDDPNAIYDITPKPHEDYEVRGDAIYLRKGNAGMIVELMNGEKIAKYYADRGAAFLGNPFAQSLELQAHSVFLVTLINRTNGNLTFTPGYVIMRVVDSTSTPLDFTDLLTETENFPKNIQKILDKSIFHSPDVIRAGEVVSKFLLYPPIPRKNAELLLEIDYLYFENNEVRTTLHYTIQKRKEDKKK